MTIIPPDDDPPVEAEFDTLEGLLAHSLLTDIKMLMHQHNIKYEQALQMIILSSQFMVQNDGPLFLHSMKQLRDDED